jgi:hypothetical protein
MRPQGIPISEGNFRRLTDTEVRRLKYQMGLDTPVVYAVKSACQTKELNYFFFSFV